MPDKKQSRIEDVVKGIVVPKGKNHFPGDVGIGLSQSQRMFVDKHPVGSVVILGNGDTGTTSSGVKPGSSQIAGHNDAAWD